MPVSILRRASKCAVHYVLKEDILFAALKVNPARIDSYCQAVDEPILEEIRKLPSGASMDQLKDRWYQGRDGSDYHYHSSRYRACYGKKAIMYPTFQTLIVQRQNHKTVCFLYIITI